MSEQSSHSQRAGAHSQQTAAGRDAVEATGDVTIVNVHQGAVYLNNSRAIIMGREYEGEGKERAYAQAAAWDGLFLNAMDEAGRLEALADPAYQRTLNSARISAASTDRPADADTLVALMSERAADSGRLTRAAIARAVQIVDDVDEQALRALVWFYGGTIRMPFSNTPEQFLDEWSDRLLALGFDGSPPPSNWLEHLHIIGATRLETSGVQALKPLISWLQSSRPAFFSPGISEEEFERLGAKYIQVLTSLPLIEHEFRPGHYRLVFNHREMLANWLDHIKRDPTTDAVALAEELFSEFKAEMPDNTATEEFGKLAMSKPTIKAYGEWRGGFEHPPHLTHVGIALAWASMKNMGVDTGGLRQWLR